MKWIKYSKQAPPEENQYIIFAPIPNPETPLIAMAWYTPENHPKGYEPGWSLLPKVWCDAITHWMPKPNPPKD